MGSGPVWDKPQRRRPVLTDRKAESSKQSEINRNIWSALTFGSSEVPTILLLVPNVFLILIDGLSRPIREELTDCFNGLVGVSCRNRVL